MLKNFLIICLLIMAGVQAYGFFQKPENRLAFLTHDKFPAVASDEPVAVQGSGITQFDIQPDFDPAQYVVPGVPNIVQLCTSLCGACITYRHHFKRFTKVRPDVAIRIIMLPQRWDARIMKQQYGIDMIGTPHTYVYDAQGKLFAEDSGRKRAGSDYVWFWMSQSLQ